MEDSRDNFPKAKEMNCERLMDPSLALRMTYCYRNMRMFTRGRANEHFLLFPLQQILLNLYVFAAQHIPELVDQILADLR